MSIDTSQTQKTRARGLGRAWLGVGLDEVAGQWADLEEPVERNGWGQVEWVEGVWRGWYRGCLG